jgi:hypothetical protein
MTPDAAVELGPFWQTFESWINGQDFLNGMVRTFAQFLPPLHGYRASAIDSNTIDGQVRIGTRTILIAGYVAVARAKHPAKAKRKPAGPLTQAMQRKLQRAGWRSRYRLRKQTAEPVFR